MKLGLSRQRVHIARRLVQAGGGHGCVHSFPANWRIVGTDNWRIVGTEQRTPNPKHGNSDEEGDWSL